MAGRFLARCRRALATLGDMPQPVSFSALAFNPVPESENRIHSDEVAREYGFRGGLVPGVVVSAYLLHPAAVAWGRDFIERGRSHVVVHSPVYDGERFRVELESASEDRYEAALFDDRGTRCASASVSLPERAPEPPPIRHDAIRPRDAERAVATRAVMERLRVSGLGAMPARWNESAEITTYLASAGEMAPVFHRDRLANPAFVLGLTNWLLGANVKMSPWLHLETHAQSYRAIEPGAELVAEAAIADLFDKKGHEFVDVDVTIYGREDHLAVASVRLRAIYRMRGV
jgi:hypothetical protein